MATRKKGKKKRKQPTAHANAIRSALDMLGQAPAASVNATKANPKRRRTAVKLSEDERDAIRTKQSWWATHPPPAAIEFATGESKAVGSWWSSDANGKAAAKRLEQTYRYLGTAEVNFSGWTDGVVQTLTRKVKPTNKKAGKLTAPVVVSWNNEGEPGSIGQVTIGQLRACVLDGQLLPLDDDAVALIEALNDLIQPAKKLWNVPFARVVAFPPVEHKWYKIKMAPHLDSRCVLISDPGTLGAGAKTRLHTPKAVTYHDQLHIINHDRSQPWAYGIQHKEDLTPSNLWFFFLSGHQPCLQLGLAKCRCIYTFRGSCFISSHTTASRL